MRFLAPFAFIAFFISGIVSLSYELTWVRLLKHVFGSDNLALSTLLTVFIGGIAFGTYVSGKIIDKYFKFDESVDDDSRYALHLGQSYVLISSYAGIEILLGLYALIVPFLLGQGFLGAIWTNFAELTIENLYLASLIKFFLSLILLIIPTFLMGLTFPMLAELLVMHNSSSKHNEMAVSNLYATNTLGSILGALLCGFVLMPKLGLNTTIYIASAMNFFIALMVLALFFLNHKVLRGVHLQEVYHFVMDVAARYKKQATTPVENQEESVLEFRHLMTILMVIAFGLGFINFSLEVVWTKILGLIIGSSTYSLTLIIATVLTGISLGAYLLNLRVKEIQEANFDYLKVLRYLLLAFAVLIVISSSLFNNLPWIFLQMTGLVNDIFANFSDQFLWLVNNVLKFFTAALICFPATLVEGLIFAFLLYIASNAPGVKDKSLLEPVGTRVACVSSLNTLGAICGSFTIGFILIPLFSKYGSGLFYSLEFLIMMAFILALVPYLLNKETKWLSRKPIMVIALSIVSVIFLPHLDPHELASGASIYHGLKYKSIDKLDYKKAINEPILFHKEGINNMVTVVENKASNAIFLKNNGKIEAGIPIDKNQVSRADMVTQVLLGQLPALINPEAKQAMMIGMGSGLSLRSLALASPSLEQIDVCEIEDLVYKAADRYFLSRDKDLTLNAFKGKKIKRNTVDARNFLISKSKSHNLFDLIVSQPSDPWVSGNLFTKEFWQLAANNLSSDGYFVQWLQLYSIEPKYLTVALRTFQSVFPEVMVFRSGSAAELILIGSKSNIEIDLDQIKLQMKDSLLKQELASIGIFDDADLMANLILVPESVRQLISMSPSRRTWFNSASVEASGVKIVKYISSLPEDSNDYKPKLSTMDNKSNYLSLVSGFHRFFGNNLTSTDDNMLLEFHTSRRLQAFFETIKENENFLQRYADPEELTKFFAEVEDKSFLYRLALSHNRLAKSDKDLHAGLAMNLAESLQELSPSPASSMLLYDIYSKRDEIERADSILFDAKSKFSDLLTRGKRAQLVIFEGLMGEVAIDSYQLYSLAKLYAASENYTNAIDLLNKALADYDETRELDKSSVFALEGDYILDRLQYQLKLYDLDYSQDDPFADLSKSRKLNIRKSLAEAYDAFHDSLRFDTYNIDAYKGLAKLYLLKTKYYKAEADSFRGAALKYLNEAAVLSPVDKEVQEQLSLIYLDMIPDSQLAFAQRARELETVIDEAIKHLRNSLIIDPSSVAANYHMASLQYKLGQIDLAYKHLKHLDSICEEEISCLDQLDKEELNEAKKLFEKLNSLVEA